MPNKRVRLQVTLVGLIVHVVHAGTDEVTILLPDAREGDHEDSLYQHDGTIGMPHAGHLTITRATAVFGEGQPPVSIGSAGAAGFDVTAAYPLDRDIIDFGVPYTPSPRAGGEKEISLPDTVDFASKIELIDGLFDARPTADTLLSRIALYGGTFSENEPRIPGTMPGTLMDDPCALGDYSLPSSITWQWEGDWDDSDAGIAVGIRKFDDDEAAMRTLVRLRPVFTDGDPTGTIQLTITNVCGDDPLRRLRLAVQDVLTVDMDFKWNYKLFRPKPGRDGKPRDWSDVLANAMLPAPRFDPKLGFVDSGGCGGMKVTTSYASSAERRSVALR